MDDWTISQTCPGYREKTIQHGPATIIIRRPILSKAEQAKREKHVQDVLGNVLNDYMKIGGKNESISRRNLCHEGQIGREA